MALRIEDYALVGDCQTAGLVGNDGSLRTGVSWNCLRVSHPGFSGSDWPMIVRSVKLHQLCCRRRSI